MSLNDVGMSVDVSDVTHHATGTSKYYLFSTLLNLFEANAQFPNTGIAILDSDSSHVLSLKTTSNLTTNRDLIFVTGDSERIITFSGNPTLNDWFDQSVKQASSPTLNDLTISTPSSIYLLSHDSFADFVANEHIDHTSVTLTAGSGLTGGGDISASRSLSLSHLGLEDLVDPNADRIMFWDDGETALKWLAVSTGLSISATNITTNDGEIVHDNLSDVHQGVTTSNSPQFVNVDLTDLTAGYLSYDNNGSLADSSVYTDGTKIGVGTSSLDGTISVQADQDIGIVVDRDGETNIIVRTWGVAAYPLFKTQFGRGTEASPSAMQSGDYIGGFLSSGYYNTSLTTTAASLYFLANENWDVSNRGSRIELYGISDGATSVALWSQWDNANLKLSNDNAQIIFGSSQDYGIYWDGNDAIHSITGGRMIIDANSDTECLRIVGSDAVNDYADFYIDGGADLNIDTVAGGRVDFNVGSGASFNVTTTGVAGFANFLGDDELSVVNFLNDKAASTSNEIRFQLKLNTDAQSRTASTLIGRWIDIADVTRTSAFDFYTTDSASFIMAMNITGPNVGIGTSTFDSSADTVLAIQNGTAPSAGTTNQSYFYAKDVSASSEMFVMDEAGNETQLSSHGFVLVEPDDNEQYPWSFYAKSDVLGMEVNVDMSAVVREVEVLSGKSFIHVRDFISEKSWDDIQKDNIVKKKKKEERLEIDISEAFELTQLIEEVEISENVYEYVENNGIIEVIQVQRIKTERQLVDKFGQRLKNGVHFDEQDGKFYREFSKEEIMLDIKPSDLKKPPKWIEKRLKKKNETIVNGII